MLGMFERRLFPPLPPRLRWPLPPPGRWFPGRLLPGRLFPGRLLRGRLFPGRLVTGRLFPGRLLPGRLTGRGWGGRIPRCQPRPFQPEFQPPPQPFHPQPPPQPRPERHVKQTVLCVRWSAFGERRLSYLSASEWAMNNTGWELAVRDGRHWPSLYVEESEGTGAWMGTSWRRCVGAGMGIGA
jgi:hypothetical protein